MPRIRTIKPQHWNDKELPKISLPAHLLWIALWNFSDDEGVFDGDVLLIRSQVFPRRIDVRTEQIEQWIGQLVKARFVIPFTYNGEGYYIHRTFKTHQKIEKPQPSRIPNELISKVKQGFIDHSPTIPRPFPDHSPQVEEGKGSVEEGKVEEGSGVAPPNPENLCYDIENYILKREKDFQAICMTTQKNEEHVKFVLKKFHLHCVENNSYPKHPIQLIAGVQKWILNEKNYPKNGTYRENSKDKRTPTTDGYSGL